MGEVKILRVDVKTNPFEIIIARTRIFQGKFSVGIVAVKRAVLGNNDLDAKPTRKSFDERFDFLTEVRLEFL